MAKAPKPGGSGTTGGEAKIEALQRRIIMRLKSASGEVIERELRLETVPFSERVAVRKATGLAFESFLGSDGEQVGLDTVQVWWWLAKRGENPMATLDQALAEWPDDVTAETFDIVEDDGQEDEDPEA